MAENKEGTTDLAKTEEVKESRNPVVRKAHGGLELTTMDQMYRFAQYVVAGRLAPKGLETAEAIVVALQMGYELGLEPMQSIQNIAVINGRPCVWGDAVKGLVISARGVHGLPVCVEWEEKEIGDEPTDRSKLTGYPDSYGWEITSLRAGQKEPIVRAFTVAEAKLAKLWGNEKKDPWLKYPSQMLRNRAATFNARVNFPDVLKGLHTVEEMRDVEQPAPESGQGSASLTERLKETLPVIGPTEEAKFEDVQPTPVYNETGPYPEKPVEAAEEVKVEPKTEEVAEEVKAQPAAEEAAEEPKAEKATESPSKFTKEHHQLLEAATQEYGEEALVNARSQLEINKFHIAGHTEKDVARIIAFLEGK